MLSSQRIGQDHWWEERDNDTGWRLEEDGMVFLDADGNRVKGLLEIDGGQFWFDENGVNVIGEVNINGQVRSFVNTLIFVQDNVEYYAGAMAGKPEYDIALNLPAGLKTVGEEAFAGLTEQAVIVPDNCVTIGPRAFADSLNLIYVSIPIGCEVNQTAFEGCGNV